MAQPVAQTVPGLVRDECEVWACKIAAFAVLIFAMRRSLPKNRQRCKFFSLADCCGGSSRDPRVVPLHPARLSNRHVGSQRFSK